MNCLFQVPHVEGKAGMVAIHDVDESVNLQEFDEKLKKMLPSYARPLFVRIIKNLPLTGTYKLKKKELQMEGFNITKIKDPVYFYDNRSQKFELLSSLLYNDILNGVLKL